uniref:Uncharacterized protein n=1 Tax=Steinernema glaseri TaxID=37863 RepID=A0A1I8AHH5_9BILA
MLSPHISKSKSRYSSPAHIRLVASTRDLTVLCYSSSLLSAAAIRQSPNDSSLKEGGSARKENKRIFANRYFLIQTTKSVSSTYVGPPGMIHRLRKTAPSVCSAMFKPFPLQAPAAEPTNTPATVVPEGIKRSLDSGSLSVETDFASP